MSMQEFTKNDSNKFPKRYWVKLINSLSGYKSANLVGTCDSKERTNLAMISSCFHLGAHPPLMGFVLRPHSTQSPRHTFMNLEENPYFTINHVQESFYKKAHQCSARYDREESEFEKTGLTESWKNFPAPFVAESQVQLGLKLREVMDVPLNKTKIIVGEIEKFFVPESSVQPDGYLDIEAAGSLVVSGLDSYHRGGRLSRLSYAKPDRETESIPLIGVDNKI